MRKAVLAILIIPAALPGVQGARLRKDPGPLPSFIDETATQQSMTKSKATLEESLGSMMVSALAGDGVDDGFHALTKEARRRMDGAEALKRLEGKLPDDVESLVRLTGSRKIKGKAKHSKLGDDPEFSEEALAKARVYLNDMVEKSQEDLDKATIACKEFTERNRETFSQTSNDIKRISGQISDLRRKQISGNENIRSLTRQRGEILSDKGKSKLGCDQVFMAKSADLKLKEDDLAVFDFILAATKCYDEASAFLQTNLSSVPKVCGTSTGDMVLHFDDPKKQAKLEHLLTPKSRKALHDALSAVAVWKGSVLQVRTEEQASSVINTTTVAIPTFTLAITPVNEEPNPGGQWKKCSNGEPDCGLLHDTMSREWGTYRDLVDELKHDMRKDKSECDAIRDNLNEQLVIVGEAKTKAMELLAETISNIQEDSQEKAEKQEQYHDLEHQYRKRMGECKTTVEEILYTNICAVKQVRDSLMGYSEVSPPENIDDCDVEDWVAEDCSVECDDSCPNPDPYQCGGWQTLTRRPLMEPNQYGIACPALTMQKKCSQFKCAVDCAMSEWGGWSGCSADCEGGEQQRTRVVMTKPKDGGQECDATLDARSCNTESCDRDCALSPWSAWTPCSMACGGGEQERVRSVLVPIRALGKCPNDNHPDRLEEASCNTQECAGDEVCIAKQDLILAIDGSGSMRESGFEVLRDFAANFTGKYQTMWFGQDAMRMGVILFGQGAVSGEGIISGAEEVSALTSDMDGLKAKIEALTWQRGITNMAQAFNLAGKMLRENGRTDAQSAVLVLTDGKPSFKFVTSQKVDELKEKNTQIFMAPVSDFPSKDLDILKTWASQPWETNYERIPGLLALGNNFEIFGNRLTAKFCPNSFSPSRRKEKDETRGFMLIHKNGWPDETCATYTLMGDYGSLDECAFAVKEQNVLAFAYEGSGRRIGSCYAENIDVTVEMWDEWQANTSNPECPNGDWEFSPYADTYAIYPDTE